MRKGGCGNTCKIPHSLRARNPEWIRCKLILFKLQNGETLFHRGPPIFVPPDGRRGFRNYPDVPVFVSDKAWPDSLGF
jgi:hypothetical protein